MERRLALRHSCDLRSLILMYGCHFKSRIADWSQSGLRLVLAENLSLTHAEHFIMYCDRFDVVHAEVVWRHDREIGARIHNRKTAALGHVVQSLG